MNEIVFSSCFTFNKFILLCATVERSGKTLKTETDMLNELPREASDRIMKLISMIYESTVSFLKSHSLKINIPDQPLARALSEGKQK